MPNKKGWNLAPQWLRLGSSAKSVDSQLHSSSLALTQRNIYTSMASEKQVLQLASGNSFSDTQPPSRNSEATQKPQLPKPSVTGPQDELPNLDLLQPSSMIREQSHSTHHSNNTTRSSFNTETSMTGDVTNNQPTVFFLGPVNNITVVPGAPLPAGGRNVADVMESVTAETGTGQAVSSPKLSPMEKAGVLATVSTAAEYTPISMANTPAKELPLAAHVNLKSGHNDRRKSWFSLLSGKNGYSVRSNSKLPSDKKITVDDVRYYLPDTTRAHVLGYMSTSLFDVKDTSIIPLYSPSPMLSTDPQAWQQHVCVGDVGCLTEKGGFKTLFNVFKTYDQNVNLGYHPPPGFTEYPFRIPLTFAREDAVKSDEITFSQGFIIDKGANRNQSSTSLVSIHLPKKQPTKCSAIHMMAGYHETNILTDYLRSLQGYMEENYICWHQLVGEGPPLIFVHTTFKAKSWAIAVSAKSSRSSKRATADLVEGERAHFWSSSDNSIIRTSFGPSSDQIKAMNTYLQLPLTATFSPEQRNDAEECHCVALKAFTIDEKRSGRWGNGSVYGGLGSAASLHSATSWRTAPVQYRSMRIEEEPALPNAP